MKKYDDTREVVFKEDYNPAKKEKSATTPGREGRLLYKKGETYFIHYKIVEKLEKLGVKMEVKNLNAKKIEDQAKVQMEISRKAA